MSETSFKRRLTGILAADAVGYSRLMSKDDHGTLASLDAARAVFRDRTEANAGRIVDTAGDSVLAVFETASGAVSASIQIQAALADSHREFEEDRRLRFRVGVHLGDVIEKPDGTVYGDGVNIAARLQTLADAGGIAISEAVRAAIGDRIAARYEDLGAQSVKNIREPVHAFKIITDTGRHNRDELASSDRFEQAIRFCMTSDGVQLAWASIGDGPPLVRSGQWMTHLEFELEGPARRSLWSALAREHTLIRYDARANGLSDWNVDEMSFDTWLRDLETVVDAAGLERFALVGISQGCAVSIAYAARHPERVSHLVLYGGFAQGLNRRRPTAEQKEAYAALLTLIRVGWGQDNPAFRQIFTSQFIPDSSKEQGDWFNELQRRATSPEHAVRYMEIVADIDVMDQLARVTAPTLVLHSRDDVRVPFELGRRMAAGIPGARFVPLQSRNHIPLDHEPAFGRLVQEILAFLRS